VLSSNNFRVLLCIQRRISAQPPARRGGVLVTPNEPPALHVVLNISVLPPRARARAHALPSAIVDAATQEVRVEIGNFFSHQKSYRLS